MRRHLEPNLVIMESFRLFKWKALQQSGSQMEVSQVEGATKFWAQSKDIEVELSSPQHLPIAQMWSKIKLNKNHAESHHESAMNHVFYWLVSNGYARPVGS